MKTASRFLLTKALTLGMTKIALAVDINPNLPTNGNGSSGTGPTGAVNNFYQFALMIGGILAFGAIVYGGIKYIFAGGNPAAQSDGKEWIKGALLGLLLLVGAYLVLKIINPQLVNLSLPTLSGIQSSGSNF